MRNLLTVLFIAFYLPLSAQTPAANQGLALIGAKIYLGPSAPPLATGAVLIEHGEITAVGDVKAIKVPRGMKVIDCKGMVIMAGFWNCHVHFIEPKWEHADSLPASQLSNQLKDMVNSRGFTHVFDLAAFDLANLLALRARIESGEVEGPAILTAGVPFAPPDGSPFYIKPLKLHEIGTAAEASAYVSKQIQSGADAIKLWSASPNGERVVPMPLEVIKAAVNTAHKLGKLVFAHPTSDTGVNIAIESGVDILAHVAPDDRKLWNTATINNLLQHKVALIPTLKLFKWELERNGFPTANSSLINTGLQQVGAYAKAGGEILFGTDVGYVADYTTTDEFEFMSKAGMSFEQILTSLTTAPAKRFGMADKTGRILAGMDADIVVLTADPKENSKFFSNVAYTISKGKIIFSSKNAAGN
ncbi:imidazolonepropionase-like amidohydrolase [Chitinophaga niastensis]|uniref:Imidazolonepropionase-like amidohydrolase n=1 Tax=Chitinophaga niastensis TaxID=536980 RepID=A0A2P8HD82_CHINA|nr:amidohydrolase family protein [Chitinophaga niastensis]PSL44189.1 imidazolonepropionase-like amidohydrolase [Chitinophaga niastensis]